MTLNQPAGHLESGESLIHAVVRETREETAHSFEPSALVGIYRWQHPTKGDTYLRFCFSGQVTGHDSEQPLDDDIHQALWLTMAQIEARQHQQRSPLVMDCLRDYLEGKRFSLEILQN